MAPVTLRSVLSLAIVAGSAVVIARAVQQFSQNMTVTPSTGKDSAVCQSTRPRFNVGEAWQKMRLSYDELVFLASMN